MSTLGPSRLAAGSGLTPGAGREIERISRALRFVAARWWWVRLAQRGLLWLAGSLALLTVLSAGAGLFNLPPSVRLAMLVALLSAPAIGLLLIVVVPLCRRLGPEQAARQIEQQIDGLENRYINAVQLAGDSGNGDAGGLFEPELVRRTLVEIAKQTSDVPVDQAVPTGRLKLAADLAGLAGIALGLFIVFAGGRFAYGLERIWHPTWQSWVGAIRIDAVRPGDRTVLAGDRLKVELEVSTMSDLPAPAEARLWVRRSGEATFSPLAMKASRPIGRGSLTGAYFFTFPAVDASFEYYVSIADTNQRDTPFRITVRDAPQVASLIVQPRYPAYLRYEQPDGPLTDGNFEAPSGSTAVITVTMNRPIVSAELWSGPLEGAGQAGASGGGGERIAMAPPAGDASRTVWQAVLAVEYSLRYRLVFRDENRQMIGTLPSSEAAWSGGGGQAADAAEDAGPGEDSGDRELPPAAGSGNGEGEPSPAAGSGNFFTATARPDRGPMVQFLRPGQDSFVRPGGSIELTFQASDDHGLSGLRLMAAKVRGGPADGGAATGGAGAESAEPGQLALEPARARHAWGAAELREPKANERPRKVAKVSYEFELGQELKAGDRVVYWAEATDNRDVRGSAAGTGGDVSGNGGGPGETAGGGAGRSNGSGPAGDASAAAGGGGAGSVPSVAGGNSSVAAGGGPQSAQSARFVLTVQDPAELAANRARMFEQLTAELLALLKEQTAVRTEAVGLAGHGRSAAAAEPATFAEAAGGVRAGQQAFNDHLMRLAKGRIVIFDAETQPIQTSLLVLAYNDAAQARGLAEEVAALADAAAAGGTIRKLVARQDQVIYALQALLGMVGRAQSLSERSGQRPDGADLPADVQEKWRKLAEELEEFIKQQRRDIAVTQTLAKKPVDDFTREDLLELEKLAAQQEKWEKFLEERIGDFSKLAEQDFSNPKLLEELIEIKDDVVMAKDALQKKAVEIAVPLEEAGLELAEALTAHIEKWLPDTPDREKWSMEEPTEQGDVPMAELPKELQDMVGPLMEEQEDLFQEVEDATSKWTDSLDKGAGWDAMDGPISNMSAQGVTGNRLPNTSEISGRSGEGRTGKSGGEMVEEEATGKGGRDTPTRLSPDPFQAGQVKDSSKEPPGGATGGGKVAGAAGEGLEGPVPQDLQQKLQRLAEKQASLRNKAEAVDARFRANNFNNFALGKAIAIMRQTEDDLLNNRYQNALRKRAVLVNNLQAQQMLLRGEIHVQADRSPELPDSVRDDIRSIDPSELPPRYRDLARQYLQKLSDESGTQRDN